jgi:hypothetical protein
MKTTSSALVLRAYKWVGVPTRWGTYFVGVDRGRVVVFKGRPSEGAVDRRTDLDPDDLTQGERLDAWLLLEPPSQATRNTRKVTTASSTS